MPNNVFCDAVPGELIIAYDNDNEIARDFIIHVQMSPSFKENHVEVVESMEQKLGSLDLRQEIRIPLQLFKLLVPKGQEVFKINWLFQKYNEFCLEKLLTWSTNATDGKESSAELQKINLSIRRPPRIVTNSFYSLASSVDLSSHSFLFTPTHEVNVNMLNLKHDDSFTPQKQILIIDSGISEISNCNIINRKNFLDAKQKDDVKDETGHGTAIALIINDVLPKAELIIYKIVDRTKFSTEWDLLAALCTANDANIINISLSYGLKDQDCKKCGRLTEEARSYVLEEVVFYLSAMGKIIVAAGGNKSQPILSYPARLEYCIAIVSLNSKLEISDFSNRSTLDQLQNKHNLVFLAPGGNLQPEEVLFENYIKTEGLGTSFASAYASAIICRIWSKNASLKASDLIKRLKFFYASKNIPGYDKSIHGNGLLKL